MHTISGRLIRAKYIDDANMAMLSLTIDQPGAERFTSQPIEALMTYGSHRVGHASARRAVDSLLIGGLYSIVGFGMAASGSQVWLMGVTGWSLIQPPLQQPEPVEARAVPARVIEGGSRARQCLQSLAGSLDA